MISARACLIAALACLGVPAMAFGVSPGAHDEGGTGGIHGEDLWDPGWLDRDAWAEDTPAQQLERRLGRHRTFVREGLPPEYAGRYSPIRVDDDTLRRGSAAYAANCASCHGAEGMGDGETALSLSPSPALLSHLLLYPDKINAYLLWSIAEGGERFGSGMPAFKGELSEQEMWEVIAYLRAGLPPAASSGTGEP